MTTDRSAIPNSHRDILENSWLAVVSTIREKDGLISTNPVSYDWDGEFLRFSTLKERVKYRSLVANPQITACIVDINDPTRYLEIRGTAQLTDDPEGALNKAIFKRLMGRDFDLDEADAERVTVKIIPQQVSAPLLYGGKLDNSER